jgi:hypothetical protein
MILDRSAYERFRVADERQALSRLTAAESLAIGEALWTSEVAARLEIAPEPRAENAARRLGIRAERLATIQAVRRP